MKKVLLGVAIIIAMLITSGIYVYAQGAKTKKEATKTEVTNAEAPKAEATKTEASCCAASTSVPACCAASTSVPACCAAKAATPSCCSDQHAVAKAGEKKDCCEVDKLIAEKKTEAKKK